MFVRRACATCCRFMRNLPLSIYPSGRGGLHVSRQDSILALSGAGFLWPQCRCSRPAPRALLECAGKPAQPSRALRLAGRIPMVGYTGRCFCRIPFRLDGLHRLGLGHDALLGPGNGDLFGPLKTGLFDYLAFPALTSVLPSRSAPPNPPVNRTRRLVPSTWRAAARRAGCLTR